MPNKNGAQKSNARKAQRKSKHRFNIAISERERWELTFFSHAPPVRQKPPREVRQVQQKPQVLYLQKQPIISCWSDIISEIVLIQI